MNWYEHEKVYCREIEPRQEDIYGTYESYCDAVKTIDYEQQDEYGHHFPATVVRWDEKYYIVMLLSLESENYYRINHEN